MNNSEPFEYSAVRSKNMKEGGSLDPVWDIVILSISPEAKWHNICLELFSLGPLEATGTGFSSVSLKAPASLFSKQDKCS